MQAPSLLRTPKRSALVRVLAAAASALLLVGGGASSASAATIATGSYHTCAVVQGGSVACWGANYQGQLGTGTNDHSGIPVTVSGITDAVEIASAQQTTCVVRSGGTVSCWGDSSYGELGVGTTAPSNIPLTVPGLSHAVDIASGGNMTCALTETGEIFCWGRQAGVLASGVAEPALTPVRFGNVTAAVDLSVTADEVCAISATDTDCWRFWDEGALGGVPAVPAPISIPGSDTVQQSTRGYARGCQLLASGQVSCFGPNEYGQLGNGTTSVVSPAAQTARGQSLVAGITDARQIAPFSGSNCAVLASGKFACWGSITDGFAGQREVFATPAYVSGINDAVEVASSDFLHICVAERSGAAWCWGAGGALGTGEYRAACPVRVVGVNVAVSARDAVTPVRRNEPDITVPEPVQDPNATPPPTTPSSLPCWVPIFPRVNYPTDPTTPVPTTPRPTSPEPTTPEPTSPTTPAQSTSQPTEPAATKSDLPAPLKPGLTITIPVPAVADLAVSGGVVHLVAFRVPERRPGKCPSTTTLEVKAAGKSKTKTFPVTRSMAGFCEITGTLKLRGRLANASRLRLVIRPKGVGGSINRSITTR